MNLDSQDSRRLSGRLLLCVLAGWIGLASAQTVAPRYNVVMILTDDLDVHTLQKAIDDGLVPNIQRYLVNEGIKFSNAFVTNSLCCPSRATYLTGQYSHNSGVQSNSAPTGGLAEFKAQSALPVWLSAAGYRTSHVGKFLNGYGQAFPADHIPGSDRCPGPGTSIIPQERYIPPGWDDWYGLLDTRLVSTYRMYDFWANDNCVVQKVAKRSDDPADLRRDGYQTDVLAWRAVQFLQQAATGTEPFYLEIMPVPPHMEILPVITKAEPYSEVWKWDLRPAPRHADSVFALVPMWPSLNEDLSDKPSWMQPGMRRERPPLGIADYLYATRQYRHRLEAIRAVDDLVGNVIRTLQDHAALDRTMIVLTSDNGYLYGQHNTSEKVVAYEESIRIPLYVRLPGSSAPRTVDAVVLNNDIAPTIVELTAARSDLAMDGTSLLPLLSGSASDWRKRFLIEHIDSGALIDVPSYDAVRVIQPSPSNPQDDLLWVEWQTLMRDTELYDHIVDPYQCESLHASTDPLRLAQKRLLHDGLVALKSCAGTQCQQLEFCPGPFIFCGTSPTLDNLRAFGGGAEHARPAAVQCRKSLR